MYGGDVSAGLSVGGVLVPQLMEKYDFIFKALGQRAGKQPPGSTSLQTCVKQNCWVLVVYQVLLLSDVILLAALGEGTITVTSWK